MKRPKKKTHQIKGQVQQDNNKFDPDFADKLLELRQQIVESGQPLLSWDEINLEAANRRGKLSKSLSDTTDF